MGDYIVQALLSNLLLASFLVPIAWILQRRYQAAALSNLVWCLILLKTLTPPIYALPIFKMQTLAATQEATALISPSESDEDGAIALADVDESEPLDTATLSTASPPSRSPFAPAALLGPFGWIWAVGSCLMLVTTLHRIVRFHLQLERYLRPAPAQLAQQAKTIARRMRLHRVPQVKISSVNVSPFVWWRSFRPLIVVPESATEVLDTADLDRVLAHEMAHIQRRDHWVRWLEWLTVITLWWNPLIWFVRRQLRMTEEIACDQLVLQRLDSSQHDYASSLLNMAELLATPVLRPPAAASAINSGGLLERRLTMIIAENKRRVPRALQSTVLVVAFAVFPFGVVAAQDFEAIERRLGGAVEAGEISLEQANLMLDALRRSTRGQRDSDRAERTPEQNMEARYARVQKAAAEIEAMVKAGKISKEEAARKILELRRSVSDRPQRDVDRVDRTPESDMEAKVAKYREAATRIEAMVKEGKVSKEIAEQRLLDLRRIMFDRAVGDGDRVEGRESRGRETRERETREREGRERERRESDRADRTPDRDMEAKVAKYREAALQIEAAIKEGKISKEIAEKRLLELRKAMFGRAEGDGDRSEARESRGSETREREGNARERQANADLERRRARLQIAADQLEKQVEEGEISKDEARKRFETLRRAMETGKMPEKQSGDESADESDEARELERRLARLEAAKREVEAAVKAGDLSPKEAKEKIEAIQSRLKDAKSKEK